MSSLLSTSTPGRREDLLSTTDDSRISLRGRPRNIPPRRENPFINLPRTVNKTIMSFLPLVHMSSPATLQNWIENYPLKEIKASINLSVHDIAVNESAYISLILKTKLINMLHINISGDAFQSLISAVLCKSVVERVFIDIRRAHTNQLFQLANACRNAKSKFALSLQLKPNTDDLEVPDGGPLLTSLKGCKEQLAYIRCHHVPLHLIGINKSPDTAVTMFQSLQCMNLVNAGINEKNVDIVLAYVNSSQTLIYLNLSENALGDESMPAIAEFLEGNSRVERLGVQCIEFGHVGVKTLARALSHNTHIQVLALKDDIVGKEGGLALAQMLMTNKRLHTLVCQYAEIDDEAANAIVEALRVNESLTVLDICYNDISPNVERQLIDAARKSKTMLNLMVADDDTDVHKQPLPSHPWWPSSVFYN